MKTKELFSVLQAHSDKALLFEYIPGQLVPANYHITEVKHVKIDAVDCGANADAWNETIIQLWESPSEIGKTEFMSTFKAMGILKKVGKMKPFQPKAEVKIEYSNDGFHTAQLYVGGYTLVNSELVLSLGVERTDCKAKEECGVPVAETATEATSCAPGSGCC